MTDSLSIEQKSKTDTSTTRVLRNRNFRLLWIGEGISLLGDQFYLVALPWLVLSLTGDALAVGTVLATAGIPRVLFMRAGGTLTDRFTPRRLIISNVARMTLAALLVILVATNLIQLWMLYVSALLFGLADAFFFPAQTSIVPRLVDKDHLQAGNALIQGTAHLSLFVGPVVAPSLWRKALSFTNNIWAKRATNRLRARSFPMQAIPFASARHSLPITLI